MLSTHNEKKSGKGVRPSRSLYYFLHFTQIQHQNQFDRADEFEADWVVELDRVGTNITPSQSSPAALKSNHTSPD